MEAVRTSETSVYLNETTWSYIPERCQLHTRLRENLNVNKWNTNIIIKLPYLQAYLPVCSSNEILKYKSHKISSCIEGFSVANIQIDKFFVY
jgi:hypothetical protein